jgi:hypothetical protein
MRLLALAALISCAGCYSQLRPGRCDRTSDCSIGWVCDLSPTPNGNGRCVPPDDGGTDADLDVVDSGGDSTPECTRDIDCPEAHPACSPSGVCVACGMGGSQLCALRSPTKPVCGAQGACVECLADLDCSADPARPICDTSTNSCVKCTGDAQCVAKLGPNPGICMSHQDGRCATPSDTIYIQDQVGCAALAGGVTAGSADMPFCTMQPAVVALASNRRVMLVRGTVQASNYVIQAVPGGSQVTMVGQQNGSIAGGAYSALIIDGVDLFARDLGFRLSAQPAVVARNAATIRLEHVTVDNNPGGGILLQGSAFQIGNSIITNNGPSADLAWGGVRVDTPSTTGASELRYVTIQNNRAAGLSCTGPVSGTGVLATLNTTGDIGGPCQIQSCPAAGPTCGAQP